MTDSTDADVEWMARLRCVMGGWNPDDIRPAGKPAWMLFDEEAFRALNWMQANGVKMTTHAATVKMVNAPAEVAGTCQRTEMSDWAVMHDAAPMTPHMAPEASQDAPKPQAGQFAPTEG